MSEPKDLSGIIHMWHDKLPPGYQNKKLLDEICRLVEHGPEVSRGFVVNSARAMHVEPDALRICLEEAGVTVKEEK